jgi:phosphoglycolate phosphatase-like HAD superfamily hydrolase
LILFWRVTWSVRRNQTQRFNLALEKTGVEPDECVVIEDSYNGVQAAHSAGMHIVATTNEYTENEDLSAADIILTCLGDPDGEKGVLKKGDEALKFDGVLHASQVVAYFSR